jgi:hypothetical protein
VEVLLLVLAPNFGPCLNWPARSARVQHRRSSDHGLGCKLRRFERDVPGTWRGLDAEEKSGRDKRKTFVGDAASSMKGECGAKGRGGR